MYSPKSSQQVLSDLGPAFPQALVAATNAIREHVEALRAEDPDYFMSMLERDTANLLHPRFWHILRKSLEGAPGVTWRDAEPYREVTITTPSGRSYVSRVKRHNSRDGITSASTSSDSHFWTGSVETFDGMEHLSLAIGYRWDRDLRSVLDPVISYREGKNNVLWCFAIEESASSVVPIVYTDVSPGLPEVDLLTATHDINELGMVEDK